MFLSQHIYQALLKYGNARPGHILEIGAFEGAGTRILAANFPDRRIYTVDPFVEDGHTQASTQRVTGQRLENQRAAFVANTENFTNVKLFECTSADFAALPIDLESLNIGIIIIDGSHHYKDVRTDTQIALRCLGARSGVIIFDDLAIEDVRRAIADFLAESADRIAQVRDIENVALYVEINDVN